MWDLQRRGSGFDGIIIRLVKNAERVKNRMQKYLHEHFLSEGHNSLNNDAEIIFIDETNPSDTTRILEN